MSSIFSRLQNQLNLLGGGQTPLSQGFVGPQQPPVQGPPTITQQIGQNYQKIAQQPGFNNALFRLGTTLLAAREQGMGLGQGLVAGQAAYNTEMDRAKKEQALQAQAEMDALRGVDLPAAVREYQYYTTLSPEQKQQYLSVKRTSPQEIFDKAAASVAGKDIGTTQTSLPKLESDVKYASRLLTELTTHPGLKDVVGVPGVTGGLLGGKIIPGTDAASFVTRLKQIEGQQFLQAYESLKGAGQITEVEGQKATDAMARLNTSQTEKEFKAAANELKDVLEIGLKRTKNKVKTGYQPVNSSGIKFLGFE